MSPAALLDALLQAGLGALLVHGGLRKQRRFVQWWQALAQYRVLPAALRPLIAHGMPLLEIALGAGLALPLFDDAAALAASALFGMFALAVAGNWAAGVARFDCGCQFGSRRSHAAVVLLRALALALLAGASLALPDAHALLALVAAAAAVLALLIGLAWRELRLLPRLQEQ